MKPTLYFIILSCFISLTSCNTSNSIRLKDSSDSQNSNLSNLINSEKVEYASIVHVDQTQRIVTIRSNRKLEKGYYITRSQFHDKENSVIKLYDVSHESIFICDILEGAPKITDQILKAGEERSKELGSYYTEATID